MTFQTGAAVLDAVVLSIVAKDAEGTYGYKIDRFKAICEAMGAHGIPGSGLTYEFEFLPGLLVRFTLWEGDEEFAPTSQILFSDNFPDAFAAEDRVVVCEYILSEMKLADLNL